MVRLVYRLVLIYVCFSSAFNLEKLIEGAVGAVNFFGINDDNLPVETLTSEQIDEARWRLQVAELVYTNDESALKTSLANMGCTLQAFFRQKLDSSDHPQWFSCLKTSGEIVVAFRGSWSLGDFVTDINVSPSRIPDTSLQVHSGFALGVRNAWSSGLQEALRNDQVRLAKSVILVGHSLGGALALTLLASGLLPEGKYELATFGAPAVFYGARPEKYHLQHANVQQWIMEEDPIPRILGSEYDVLLEIAGSLIGNPQQYGTGLFGDVLVAIADHGKMAAAYSKGYVHVDEVKWIRSGGCVALTSSSPALRIRGMSVKGGGDHTLDSYDRGLKSLQRSLDGSSNEL